MWTHQEEDTVRHALDALPADVSYIKEHVHVNSVNNEVIEGVAVLY